MWWVRTCFINAIAAMLFIGGAGSAQAVPITFEHVCTSLAACDNDANFTFTITLDSTVVIANGSYDTASDGGAAFVGWTATSSIGDGFSISGNLSNISNIGGTGITFGFGGSGVLASITENGAGGVIQLTTPRV